MHRVFRRGWEAPSENPVQSLRSAGLKRHGVPFSLGTFFWASKRKYLGCRAETRHKNRRDSDTKPQTHNPPKPFNAWAQKAVPTLPINKEITARQSHSKSLLSRPASIPPAGNRTSGSKIFCAPWSLEIPPACLPATACRGFPAKPSPLRRG